MRRNIILLALAACADPTTSEQAAALSPRCTPLVCTSVDCGPLLGPAADHAADVALDFDIHPGTGNLYLSALDLVATPAVGSPLAFERHYNSQADATNYGFGAGWSHTYSWRISMPGPSTARIVTDRGRAIVFTGGPSWTPPIGERGTLQGSAAGFTYTSRTGTVYTFDSLANQGRLLSIQTATAPSPIVIAYSGGTNIASVTSGLGNNGHGSSLVFASSNGFISSITDPSGRVWTYSRDAQQRLNQVAFPNGGLTRYTMTNVVAGGVVFSAGSGQITQIQTLQAPGTWIDAGLFSYEGAPGQVTRAASSAINGTLQNHVTLSYTLCTDRPSSTVAMLAGGDKRISLAPIAGVPRVTSISATAGVGRAGEATQTAMVWNPDLTLSRVTAGSIASAYSDYDAKGNARTVVEGVGSSVERTTRYTYHPVLQTVLTERRTSVDGVSDHVITNDYDADYDGSYNAAPTSFVHQRVERGKTDTQLTGNATTDATYTTKLEYDAYLRPTRVTYANGRAEYFTYFPATAVADAQLRLATHYVYTTGASTLVDQVARYDANGRVLEVRDVNGVATSLDRDELGNITRETTSFGGQTSVEQYTYNLSGQLLSRVTPGGNALRYEYDAAARRWRTRAETPGGSIAWSEVAVFGDQNQVLAQRRFTGLGATATPTCGAEEAADFCKSMTYDSFRRRASLTLLGSSNQVCAGADCSVTYSYDANGNPACSTEAGLHTTCVTRDGRARLASLQLPNQTTVTFAYDINDRLIAKRDPRDPANGGTGGTRVSTFVWDDFGRQISRTTLDSGRFIMNYDAAGLRTSTLDARGIRINSGFDLAGRQISYTVPSDTTGNQDLTYVYDETGYVPGGGELVYGLGKGRLTTVSSRAADGTRIRTHRSYDYLGRITDEIEERGSSAVRKQYAFGADGELTSYTFPDGEVMSFQYPVHDGSLPRGRARPPRSFSVARKRCSPTRRTSPTARSRSSRIRAARRGA